ncbi:MULTISPECIES: hypothetical protein [unclassified Rathayibacter]|uniref:hypothetical protein n=1 Tax=unclassified Rathayibacter TaxID=2609250 RepID=UPI0006FB6E59|nr:MULTISPECIES: hypothetical protein [unclassified Rathayibacter]KQS09556.1 hypothetical protein ASG06_17145 [Rathayibacter sp. Leaf185]
MADSDAPARTAPRHRVIVWGALASPSGDEGRFGRPVARADAELSGYRLTSEHSGAPVPASHFEGTVLRRGTSLDRLPVTVLELTYPEMRGLDADCEPLSGRISVPVDPGPEAWLYSPRSGLEPTRPEFSAAPLILATPVEGRPVPEPGQDIMLVGTHRGDDVTRRVILRVRLVDATWGPNDLVRLEGVVRSGEWTIGATATIRIGTTDATEGSLLVTGRAAFDDRGSDGPPPSDLLRLSEER